jgi:hypothetical protein
MNKVQDSHRATINPAAGELPGHVDPAVRRSTYKQEPQTEGDGR